MDLGSGSVFSILRRLEHGSISDPVSTLHGHTAFVRRMQCTNILSGHRGCVNRLALSQDTTLLLSGSDDCKLRLWRIHSPTHVVPLAAVSPGHYANIFGVAFMPNTNNAFVASAGLDRQVRHTHVPTARSTLWACHDKMVKTVTPVDSNTFISASKDGTARLFDTRVSPISRSAQHSNVVIRLTTHPKRPISLNSALISPLCSHHILVAANDSWVRIFDLRLSASNRSVDRAMHTQSLTSTGHAIEEFCPPHLHASAPEQSSRPIRLRSTYATYATFSSDAKQIVASFYDDTVHVFERSQRTPITSCKSPFLSHSAKQAAVWEITQDAARVLHSKYPSLAIGRANRVLEIDPENVLALVYKADGLLRREGVGDFRASYATLDKLIRMIKEDKSRIAELWGYEKVNGRLCFHSGLPNLGDKAEIWLKVFEYMQALALYRMISQFQFGMFPPPKSSEALLTKKRLEHLSRLCRDLEQYGNESLWEKKMSGRQGREAVRERALGGRSEHDGLYRSAASKIRGKVLCCMFERFVCGIDALRDGINDRMLRMMPGYKNREFVYSGEESSEACDGDDSDEEQETRKQEDVEMVDAMRGSGEEESSIEEELWGKKLREQEGCKSFHGHTSRQTDIKEASFYGCKDQVVLSGSDDGHVYIWCAKTAELLNRVYADRQIVNCILGHPRHAMIISSGIDETIKIIATKGEGGQLEIF